MSSHLSFNCVLLLLPLLLPRSLEEAYKAEVGQNANLPCSYTLTTPGTLVPVCWGRGSCPLSQCSNLLLNSDNSKVTYQKSSRFQLKGNFHKGDVSLTIQNVTLADSGTYCCRIQFPGIMNDKKLNLQLVVKPATVTPQIAQRHFTTALPRMLITEGLGAETQTMGTLQDRNKTQMFTLTEELQDSAAASRLGAYVGAGVTAALALTLIVGALILKWHFHRKRKLQNSSLITLANLPPMGLVNAVAERMRSEQNIYTIEENVYEIENSNEYYCFVSSGQPSEKTGTLLLTEEEPMTGTLCLLAEEDSRLAAASVVSVPSFDGREQGPLLCEAWGFSKPDDLVPSECKKTQVWGISVVGPPGQKELIEWKSFLPRTRALCGDMPPTGYVPML